VAKLETPKVQEILEEILELLRINQKLIRNPDGSIGANLEQMNSLLRELLERTERTDDPLSYQRIRKFHPMMFDELLHMSASKGGGYVGIQMLLALVRHQFPWIHDAGIETINILRSRPPQEEKHQAIEEFRKILEFSFDHPMMREAYGGSKEYRFFYWEIPHLLMRAFEQSMAG